MGRDTESVAAGRVFKDSLDRAKDQHGRSLADLSSSSPVLVVFLRHLG
jgi:hypothetical protein